VHAVALQKLVTDRFGNADFMDRLNIVKQQQRRLGREMRTSYQDYCNWILDRSEFNSVHSAFVPVIEYLEYLHSIDLIDLDGTTCTPKQVDLTAWARSLDARSPFLSKRRAEPQENDYQLEVQIGNDEHRELKMAVDERAALLLAADTRLLREGEGSGNRCSNCKLSYLEAEAKCPFCDSTDCIERLLTPEEYKNLKHKYRTSVLPNTSLKNSPQLDQSLIERYLNN